MQILTRNNRVIDYCPEDSYESCGSTVVCRSKGISFEDATIVNVDSVPTDIDAREYYYVLGKFIQGSHKVLYTTVPTTGWTEVAPYSIEIQVSGISERDNPVIGLLQGDTVEVRESQRESWGYISKITTQNGKITVYADRRIPTTPLNIQIKCVD